MKKVVFQFLITRSCVQCGAEYTPTSITQRFCKACGVIRAKGKKYVTKKLPIRQCDFCGKEFQPRSKTHKFCSNACCAKRSRGDVLMDVTCPICGQVFKTTSKHRKYCSERCYLKANSRMHRQKRFCRRCGIELTPATKGLNWRGETGTLCDKCREETKLIPEPQEFTCVVCGKTFMSIRKRLTCSAECAEINRAGNSARARELADKRRQERNKNSINDKIKQIQDSWEDPFGFGSISEDENIYGNMVYL